MLHTVNNVEKHYIAGMPKLSGIFHLGDDIRRGHIVGLTSIDSSRLFVLHFPSNKQIEVYDSATFKLQQKLDVVGLNDSMMNGLTSCTTNSCLYISDCDKCVIHKLQLKDDNKVMKWRVFKPTGLSVNNAHNLIVACLGSNKLLEYKPSGSLVREVNLQSMPWHSIQMASGQFIVCFGTWGEYDVAEVDATGQVVVSYKDQLQSMTKNKFEWACHLAVDKNNERVFIADSNNNRIVMLNRKSKCAQELDTSVDGKTLQHPSCLYMDQTNRRLYVGEWIADGRIFMYDIPCL